MVANTANILLSVVSTGQGRVFITHKKHFRLSSSLKVDVSVLPSYLSFHVFICIGLEQKCVMYK